MIFYMNWMDVFSILLLVMVQYIDVGYGNYIDVG